MIQDLEFDDETIEKIWDNARAAVASNYATFRSIRPDLRGYVRNMCRFAFDAVVAYAGPNTPEEVAIQAMGLLVVFSHRLRPRETAFSPDLNTMSSKIDTIQKTYRSVHKHGAMKFSGAAYLLAPYRVHNAIKI